MFNDNYLRKDINIGFSNESFELLPAITISKTGKYFEIDIKIFWIYITICYSIHNYIEDD